MMVRVKLFPEKRKGNKVGKNEDEEPISRKQLSLGGKRREERRTVPKGSPGRLYLIVYGTLKVIRVKEQAICLFSRSSSHSFII